MIFQHCELSERGFGVNCEMTSQARGIFVCPLDRDAAGIESTEKNKAKEPSSHHHSNIG